MNIIISGMTCSGKTTLANKIRDEFNDTTIIHEDDYMKDLKDMPHRGRYYLMDLPSAYHLQEFTNDANLLICTGKTLSPSYDVRNNQRLAKNNLLIRKSINVFEGLHTISTLSNLPNSIKVFMDIPPNICLLRRISRDLSMYNTKKEDIEKYFNEIIMSIYKTHIESQRDNADIVIRKDGDVKCLYKKLQTF